MQWVLRRSACPDKSGECDTPVLAVNKYPDASGSGANFESTGNPVNKITGLPVEALTMNQASFPDRLDEIQRTKQ